MVPFNLTPAPSTPIPFVSACRLWRRGLKWWLLIGIVMQALLLLATCIPGKLDEVSSQDELKQCLTRRKVADSKIVHIRRLPDSWANLHMKATDLIGRSIFDTDSRGFRRSRSHRRNSRVILTDRHESRADFGGN